MLATEVGEDGAMLPEPVEASDDELFWLTRVRSIGLELDLGR